MFFGVSSLWGWEVRDSKVRINTALQRDVSGVGRTTFRGLGIINDFIT